MDLKSVMLNPQHINVNININTVRIINTYTADLLHLECKRFHLSFKPNIDRLNIDRRTIKQRNDTASECNLFAEDNRGIDRERRKRHESED